MIAHHSERRAACPLDGAGSSFMYISPPIPQHLLLLLLRHSPLLHSHDSFFLSSLPPFSLHSFILLRIGEWLTHSHPQCHFPLFSFSSPISASLPWYSNSTGIDRLFCLFVFTAKLRCTSLSTHLLFLLLSNQNWSFISIIRINLL